MFPLLIMQQTREKAKTYLATKRFESNFVVDPWKENRG